MFKASHPVQKHDEPGNRATAQGEDVKIDLEAILNHCGQKSKYDSHLYRNQLNLTTTKTL